MLRHKFVDNDLSPGPMSILSSEINQTPNYNFKESNGFELDNIQLNRVSGHFIDVGSEFISYANSCSGSGYR
jgi:hypothetical protein